MEQLMLQKIIEDSHKSLVIAKRQGNFEEANELNILIAETQALLQGLENAN